MKQTISFLTRLFIIVLITVSCANDNHKSKSSVAVLKCEHLIHPIGIDSSKPRFTWQMKSTGIGSEQTAFEIVVGTDSSEVAKGNGDFWNSGKIKSGESIETYNGKALDPFTEYYWTVRIWDNNAVTSEWATIATFETGMMDSGNWNGDWISDTRDINLKPAPYFRKEFKTTKKIKSAKVYIAVGGLYELYLNGERVGNHRLDPMYTRFDRRTLYVTHDVSDILKNGKNAVGVLLGNGWYNHQSTAVWYFDKAPWRARPKFCLDMHIVYEDGSKEIVKSGTDWKTSLSPVIFNSIYTAEHYDARLEIPGWDTPDFDDSGWEKAIAVSAPSNNITSQVMHPIRNVKKILPVTMKKFSEKSYVFDLGRNIAGVSKLKIKGKAGTEIRLIHAEKLDKNGKADLSNIDVHYRPTDDSDPFATDIYILSGGEDEFMPYFNYKGFQYVEITSDQPVSISKESLTGYFMHSDLPPVGYINSSNPTLNKIWEATNSSYLSNLHGYPTDCPQREKNGWTGDAHIAIETGLYNFDGITVYEKWLADHRDEQQPNGVLPAIIPTSGWGYHWANGPDWTSTIAILPWNIYLFYGDSQLLEQCYENIKRYVDHITEISPNGLTTWGLGDWVPVSTKPPVEFTSTIYYYTDAIILANAAKLFGKTDDFNKYSSLASKIKSAFNEKYLTSETGIYGKGLQTELSTALYWGLVPDSLKNKVTLNLSEQVIRDNRHINVGLLGSKAILNALSENGYSDLAYEVALQETFPSWGWWIKNGATTLYENWRIDSNRDLSMNHIMFGEIGAWFYKALGGIFPDPENPGFKNIILKPNFVSQLEHFEASHTGPYGKIVSKWKRDGSKILYDLTIPANSSATLFLDSDLKINDIENKKGIKSMGEKENLNIFKIKSGQHTITIN